MPAPKAEVELRATDKTKAAFDAFHGGLKRLDSAVGGFSAGFERHTARITKWGAALAIAGGTAFFIKAVRDSAAFGEAMSEVSALTGAVGEDLAFIREEALRFGRTTTQSATQAAEAFKLVAGAKPDLLGNAAALSQVTGEAIKLSEAAGIELPAAAETLGQSLNQFGEAASEAGRYINVLAAGAKFGSSEIEDTAASLQKAGVVASQAGLSFEETNAAIQLLAAAGIKGSEAGTALRGVLLKLETQNNDTLKPSVVGVEQALINLGAANLSTTERVKLFGQENVVAAQILADQATELGALTTALTGTSTAYDQARTRTDNLAGDVVMLKNAFEGLTIQIGGGTEPILRDMTQALTDVLLAFGDVTPVRNAGDELTDFGDIVANIAKKIIAFKGMFSQVGDAVGAWAAKMDAWGRATEDRFEAIATGNWGAVDEITKRQNAEFATIDAAREENMVAINEETIALQGAIDQRRAMRDEEYALWKQRQEQAEAAAADAAKLLSGVTAPTSTFTPAAADPKALKAIEDMEARMVQLDEARLEREIAQRDRDIEERERFIEGLNTELLAIEGHIGNVEAVEAAAHMRRQEVVQLNFDNKLITEEQRRRILEDLELRHQETLTDINLAGWNEREKFVKLSTKNQAAMIFGHLEQVTAGVANNNRVMFNLNKVAAIGNAVINTAEGITQMLKLPFPLNIAMAAVVAAAGAAQILAIKSTQFGGGTTPSLANTPTVNNQPVPTTPPGAQPGGPQEPIIIVINGAGGINNPGTRDEILGSLRDEIENGDAVLIGPASRQMEEIKAQVRASLGR